MISWTNNISAVPLDSISASDLASHKTTDFLLLLRDALGTGSGQAIVDLLHDEGWYREYVVASQPSVSPVSKAISFPSVLICEWGMNSVPKNGLLDFFNEKGLPRVKPASVKLDSAKSTPHFTKDWITWVKSYCLEVDGSLLVKYTARTSYSRRQLAKAKECCV
jgi:hypothetical protein